MDTPMAQVVLNHLPLAEATLQTWRWIFNDNLISECFEKHRGRNYERVISFDTIVHLTAEALVNHQGNAKRCFEQAVADGTLNGSVQAAYGKLRRMSIEISESFLSYSTQRLHHLYPDEMSSSLPASLDEFNSYVFDGKTIKYVKKLLKPLRGKRGGLLGGRVTTALSFQTGFIEAVKADPDGYAAEVNMVPGLVDELRDRDPSRRNLWIADRGFCKQKTIETLSAKKDSYIVRYAKKLLYTQDNMFPEHHGTDEEGRRYDESRGWIGTVGEPTRFAVRRIVLHLDDDDVDGDNEKSSGKKKKKSEDLILITNLHDMERYPAIDILDAYRQRWGIERVFQELTEVFGLKHLIGSSPKATIFQFAFCSILYNIIQLHRAYLAQDQEREVSSISTEKYFQDVRDDLIACSRLIGPDLLPELFVEIDHADDVREVLRTLLHDQWKDRWEKAPPNRHRKAKTRTGPQPGEGYGQCFSVCRLLLQAKRAKQEARTD